MNPENDPVFGNSKPGDESSDGSEADKRANKTVHDKLHEQEKDNDEKFFEQLSNPNKKKNLLINLGLLLNKIMMVSVIGFIVIKVWRMDEKTKYEKLDRVKSIFGLGYKSEVQQRQDKLMKQEQLKTDLYKQVGLLKKMNEDYAKKQEMASAEQKLDSEPSKVVKIDEDTASKE